ncbi:hypothetical protein [Marinobacter salarius]
MPKKDAPLRGYWGDHVETEKESLERIMEGEAERRGIPFERITHAANFAAKELTKLRHEGSKACSPSALTRNPNYRAVLLKHVANRAPKEITGSERLKFQAQIRELRKSNADLEKQLTTALEDRSAAEGKLAKSMVHTGSQEAVIASFSVWKRVIDKLLAEIEETHFDIERRTVFDSITNKTLLREKDFPEGFFDWLARSGK